MGRPKELTDEERAKLIAEGFTSVEVWMPDIWSDAVWERVYEDCKLISGSEERADVNLWVEGAARESMRLIEEMEENDL
ncbi:MAG: antitoxin MazE-like protein [Rhizobiaceae bacterium]